MTTKTCDICKSDMTDEKPYVVHPETQAVILVSYQTVLREEGFKVDVCADCIRDHLREKLN